MPTRAQDRSPNPGNVKPHSLEVARKGTSGVKNSGYYRCNCGEEFSHIIAFESHRATARRGEIGK